MGSWSAYIAQSTYATLDEDIDGYKDRIYSVDLGNTTYVTAPKSRRTVLVALPLLEFPRSKPSLACFS